MRLIDGDELLKPVGSYERVKYTYEYGDVVTVEDIELMPTIDAEPVRHGKWIRILDTRFGEKLNDIIGCSVCNIYYSSMDLIRRNYCPHCGAKMDEDEISNIAKESADKISKALEKVRAKGMQKQNIKEDGEP